MMENFKVVYDGEYYDETCQVYAIDTIHHKFLIVGNGGWFKWVNTKDCRLLEDEDD